MRSTITTLLVLAATVRGYCGELPPATMTHVIVQYSGTDIPADSFMAKPKTFWRAANSFCRGEEEADPAQSLHLLTIMNEPDAWLIDLASNRAKHIVDKGPTFNCRLPIFAFDQEMATGRIGQLEIGHELEFFGSHNAQQVEGPDMKSFKALYYELTIGDAKLELVERADIRVPIMIALIQGDKVTSVRYSQWEQVPFRPQLFAKPVGVTMEETK